MILVVFRNKAKNLEIRLLLADPYWPKTFNTEKNKNKTTKKASREIKNAQKVEKCLVPILVRYHCPPLYSVWNWGSERLNNWKVRELRLKLRFVLFLSLFNFTLHREQVSPSLLPLRKCFFSWFWRWSNTRLIVWSTSFSQMEIY